MQDTAPSGPTILVAEDNVDQRALLTEILVSAGYRVLHAGDGDEAMDVARREQPDLVLMDVTMPGTSGWNAMRILKSDPETISIPIIVITGLSDTWDRDASLAAGADEYLAKPVPPARLLNEVKRIVKR